MEKISINLLPPEFTAEEVKLGKFYKMQALGISIILLMIFLSIVLVSLRIFQSNRIKIIQTQASEVENKVSSLSSKEVQLMLLKNRLTAINQYLGTSSKQAEMYTLVKSLMPPALQVGSVSVKSDGTVLVTAHASDANTLDKVFGDLLDKEKIVSIETINRGREEIYRVSFQVKAKI